MRVDVAAERVVGRSHEFVGTPDEVVERLLLRVVELHAVAADDLQAVVVGRIVGGADHDAGLEWPLPGQEGQGRRGHHAEPMDVGAHRRHAGHDGGHEHVARTARIAADEDRPAERHQRLDGRPPERLREGGLEIDVGLAADAVGAEQSSHRVRAPGSVSGSAPRSAPP